MKQAKEFVGDAAVRLYSATTSVPRSLMNSMGLTRWMPKSRGSLSQDEGDQVPSHPLRLYQSRSKSKVAGVIRSSLSSRSTTSPSRGSQMA